MGSGSLNPPGCECIGKIKTLELLGSLVNWNVEAFGENYGTYCAAWKDGECSSGSHPQGPLHSCRTHQGCEELFPSLNFDQDQSWCCYSWCFVNATTCTEEIQD